MQYFKPLKCTSRHEQAVAFFWTPITEKQANWGSSQTRNRVRGHRNRTVTCANSRFDAAIGPRPQTPNGIRDRPSPIRPKISDGPSEKCRSAARARIRAIPKHAMHAWGVHLVAYRGYMPNRARSFSKKFFSGSAASSSASSSGISMAPVLMTNCTESTSSEPFTKSTSSKSGFR